MPFLPYAGKLVNLGLLKTKAMGLLIKASD
jgi:hypothetical protein